MRGLLVMLIAFAFCFLAEPVKADDRTALDGIYVEDISVGGMTEEQITQAVNDKIEQLKPSVIQCVVKPLAVGSVKWKKYTGKEEG